MIYFLYKVNNEKKFRIKKIRVEIKNIGVRFD